MSLFPTDEDKAYERGYARGKEEVIQRLYEDQLREALRNLLHWHRDGNRLTRQDAFRRLNKTVSDQIEEIVREEKDD